MPMMSFETVANVVAIAIILILAAIYLYGKRHFGSGPADEERQV